MARGRPPAPLILTDDQRDQLASVTRSTSMPHGLVQRAHIVLLCADGLSNKAVAERAGVAQMTVGKWRRRFIERGIEGLHDEFRPGPPRRRPEDGRHPACAPDGRDRRGGGGLRRCAVAGRAFVQRDPEHPGPAPRAAASRADRRSGRAAPRLRAGG